jgi:hypothetical protein
VPFGSRAICSCSSFTVGPQSAAVLAVVVCSNPMAVGFICRWQHLCVAFHGSCRVCFGAGSRQRVAQYPVGALVLVVRVWSCQRGGELPVQRSLVYPFSISETAGEGGGCQPRSQKRHSRLGDGGWMVCGCKTVHASGQPKKAAISPGLCRVLLLRPSRVQTAA